MPTAGGRAAAMAALLLQVPPAGRAEVPRAAADRGAERGQAQGVAEELDALIAATNALESLRVTYRGEREGAPVVLRVSYQAPERAFLELDDPSGRIEWWFAAGRSVFHST